LIANRIVDRGREFVSGSNGVAAWTSWSGVRRP